MVHFEQYLQTNNRFYDCVGYQYKPDHFVAAFTEITEQKRVEKLLKQTKQNYETFFNRIDEFLFVLDEQGNILHVNDTVLDRLGYTKAELLGKPILMVHPPERCDEVNRIVGEMLSGITEFCPIPIVTKDGIEIPVETRVTQGIWDSENVLFGVTKDISSIKLSEEKFSKLFHLNPSASGLSDIESQKYIEVNEAFYNFFGFDKNDVIGKTAMELDILPLETRKKVLLYADSDGMVKDVQVDLKAKNGDVKHVLLLQKIYMSKIKNIVLL